MRLRLFAILAATLISAPVAAQEEAIAEAVPVAEAESDATPPQPDVASGEPAQAESTEAESAQEKKTPSLRPLTVAADLMGETKITGTLVDSTALQMKTAFGEAQIPLTEIAGVRFPVGEDNSTTVVMLNGDSITGATDLKFLTVETEWGTAKINGQSIVSLLFVPGLQWEGTNSINGKRWALTEARPQSRSGQVTPGSSSSGTTQSLNSGGGIGGVTIQGSSLQGSSLQGSSSIQGSSSAPSSVPFGTLPPQGNPQLNLGPRFQ